MKPYPCQVCMLWRADRIFKGSFELRSNLLKDDFLHFGQLSPWIVSAIAGSLIQPSWDPPKSQRSVAVSGNGHAVHCHGICYWGRLRASNTGATLRHCNRWRQTHIRFPHEDPYLK